MLSSTQISFPFTPLKRRTIQAELSGGDNTSDGGVLLLRQIDRQTTATRHGAWAAGALTAVA